MKDRTPLRVGWTAKDLSEVISAILCNETSRLLWDQKETEVNLIHPSTEARTPIEVIFLEDQAFTDRDTFVVVVGDGPSKLFAVTVEVMDNY